MYFLKDIATFNFVNIFVSECKDNEDVSLSQDFAFFCLVIKAWERRNSDFNFYSRFKNIHHETKNA